MLLRPALLPARLPYGRLLLLGVVLLLCIHLMAAGSRATAQAPADDHSNVLDNTATSLILGAEAAGSLEAPGDVDVFAFTVTDASKDVWLYTTGDTNTAGYLFDDSSSDIATAVPIASNDDSIIASGDNFYISANLEPGTYFVAVTGPEDGATGDYMLRSLDLTVAPVLTLGTSSDGTLTPGEIDVFQFALNEVSQDVWLYSTGDTDTVGFLFLSAGISGAAPFFLTINDDGALADESNFYLGANLEEGTYYLAVIGAADSDGAPDTGQYQVQSMTGTDQVGEISEGPGVVTLGSLEDGIIAPGEDQDVFKLDLSSRIGETNVVLYSAGDVDTIGTLLDADGDEVDYNDDTRYEDGSFNFRIARALEPEVYYIAVTGYVGRSGESTGPYRLHVEEVADQSGSRGGATVVTPNSSAMGFISKAGDTDYFSFSLSTPTVASIYTVGSTDTVGELQDGSGNTLSRNDDGRLSPAGHNAFLIEQSLAAGTYYVSVRGFDRETGPYRLVVETVEDPGPAAATAGTLELSTPVTAAIEPEGDTDLFKLELAPADTDPSQASTTEVVFYSTGNTDTKATLLASDGVTELNSDDDSGDGFNFLIRTSLAPGTYYVRVQGYGNNETGSYSLFAEPVTPLRVFGSLPGLHQVGRISTGHDQGIYRFAISNRGPVWIYAVGSVDSYGALYDSEFRPIASNDDGGILGMTRSFSIRETLDAGTYYIGVSSYGTGTGSYSVHLHNVVEPGDSIGSATPLEQGVPTVGTIQSPGETDFFRFTFSDDTNFRMHAAGAYIGRITGEITDGSGNEIDVNVYPTNHGFFVRDNLPAGTYYVKLSSGGAPVPYSIILLPDARLSGVFRECSAETAELTDEVTRERLFGDPLYACQWHLKNREELQEGEDINIEPVWEEGITGQGVWVVVVDDGMDHGHEDLSPNADPSLNYDYTGHGDIYQQFEHHGTLVTGVLAARDNGIGVRGVAPRATVFGHNFLAGQSDYSHADSMTRSREVAAVSNNSWGPRDGPGLGFADMFWEEAVKKGTREGFGGKGTFYVFAAGNGGRDGDDANLDEHANFYAVTSACSVNDRGRKSNFSEVGASLWVCAPGGGTRDGYRGLVTTDNSDRYRDEAHGTSFSAPIVSGVAALLRQVNGDLTWRDLKLILAASARKNDPDHEGWEDGARKYGSDVNTGVYTFNHSYGFGVVNAKAAVDLARDWEIVPPLRTTTVKSSESLNLNLPNSGSVETSLTLDTDTSFTEFIEVKGHFNHPSFRDAALELVSPSGATSELLSYYESESPISLTGQVRLGSAKHLGENPNGVWTLRIADMVDNQVSGTLISWEITVYGHAPTPAAPRILTLVPGEESLTVTWEEPGVRRGSIVSYDLRYIPTSEDETDENNWTVVSDVWTADGGSLEYEITRLAGETEYDVQLRAANAEGYGAWSATTAGVPVRSTATCATGTALDNPAGSPDLVADCDALLALRDDLEGTTRLNWSASLSFLEWDGVNEGSAGARVTHLVLPGMGLNGEIPATLGALSALEALGLSGNQLTGVIPPELGGLASLRELRLSDNSLSGDIPAALGNAGALEVLDLSDNGLDGGIPAELASLASLTELRLAGNSLSGAIPAGLGGIGSLEVLDLSSNEISGPIPTELRGLNRLRELHLGGNGLNGPIPSEVIVLSSLERVDLGENALTGGLPAPAEATPSLQFLDLSLNMLSGSVPGEVENWPGLVELDLSGNELSGALPGSWAALSSLERLDLSRNSLSEAIPAGLGQLGSLRALYLNDNRLTGDFPDWQGNLDGLDELYLANNQLTDCVPGVLRGTASNDLDNLGLAYCDVLLKGLKIQGATLDPEFDASTTDYEAIAGPSRVTIVPDGETGVSFGFLDDDGVAIPDADADEAGQQLDLGTSGSTVRVVVTSVDSMATLTYQISFRRAGGPGVPIIDASTVTPGTSALTVSWNAPASDGGFDIIAYDLRYIESGASPRSHAYWSTVAGAWERGEGDLSATIEGLIGGVEYDVQIRAFNGAQYSAWSSLVTGTPEAEGCGTGQAIADPTNNPGLVSDCGVLLALKATLPDNTAAGWSTQGPLESWQGVTLGGAPQRVTGLDLSGEMISMPIPSLLGRLDGLAALDLSGNEFSGPVPPQLRNLAALADLNLSGNQLSGAVPSWLVRLPNLESLDLSENLFTGRIPTNLGGLINLKVLDLSENRLTRTIPSSFGNITTLETLNLSGNQLEGRIPGTFSRLPNLIDFNISQNRLGGSIPFVAASGTVDLSQNGLTGGIPAFDGQVGPRILDLSGNKLTGVIPGSWGAALPAHSNLVVMENVNVLRLGGNELTGTIPSTLGSLTDLTELDLSDNGLTGALPEWLPSLSGLEKIDLGGNELTGEIPSELGSLANLELLDLSGNQLSGQISSKLAGGSNSRPPLKQLLLGENDLTGVIPPELGSLATLTHLDLSDGRLSGGIPSQLGNLAGLEELHLNDNGLTGPIPAELGDLTSLEVMRLESNDLSGPIPDSLGGLVELTALDLGDNGLTGAIPMELGALTSLETLNLTLNQLSGPIPAELGNLTGLEELGLGDNGLTGPIPSQLGNLENLEEMDLHHNELTDEIPGELGNLVNLKTLLLSYNGLSGEPPEELGNLKSLESLWLFENQFTGGIPDWIRGLTQLQELVLRGNSFSGSVPAWLSELTQLTQLYMANNNLTGCIPAELLTLAFTTANDFVVLGLPFCPDAPQVLSVTKESGSLTISWSVPNDPDGIIGHFEVRYIRSDASGKDNDANWTMERVSSPEDAAAETISHTITGLTDGVEYDIQVRAVTADGEEGPWSPTRVETPGEPAPPPVVEPPVVEPPEGQRPRRYRGGGGSPTLAVLPQPEVSTRTLTFKAFVGQESPPPGLLQLWSPSTGSMTFKASSGSPWVSVSPDSGDSTGPKDRLVVNVSVDASQLQMGRHRALLQIEGTGFSISPLWVQVFVDMFPAAFHGTLAPEYDTNGDFAIGLSEAHAAARDYFGNTISLEKALEVAGLYFSR